MELNIRMLKDSDWNTLVEWWDAWPEWPTPPKGLEYVGNSR